MERKSTKRRLNRPEDTEWLWTKSKTQFNRRTFHASNLIPSIKRRSFNVPNLMHKLR